MVKREVVDASRRNVIELKCLSDNRKVCRYVGPRHLPFVFFCVVLLPVLWNVASTIELHYYGVQKDSGAPRTHGTY